MKDCTVYKTVDLVGKRWALCVLFELYKGDKKEKRFNELKRQIIGITPKTLSTRLKELEEADLVERKVDSSVVPVRSEYWLTESGEDLITIIHDIKKWGLKWKFENRVCELSLCKQCKI
ncbi:MAG: winged helix-turn-helix transcriptional regulator [Methanosarcinaceae archaeon]